VSVSRYGVKEGGEKEGGRKGSRWWKDIFAIHRGKGFGVGSWYDASLVREMGDETKTLLW